MHPVPRVIDSIVYPHRMGIANRDIKLENILLSSPEYKPLLKMCDFGYSINTDHSAPETAVGTPEYTGAFGLDSCPH